MNTLAPIALFTYNRPEHTRRTVEALVRNDLAKESDLIIFSDGAKGCGDESQVSAVREYLGTVSGFKSVTVNAAEHNRGLAASIISGVTAVVRKHGKIIVLEDDLVTSPYFLRYMNDALEFYENEERVISIHGYTHPVTAQLPETFFLRGADCWGWATWQRGWIQFETDGAKLLNELQRRHLLNAFDLDGNYPFSSMLKGQIAGRNDSWAIRWHAAAFLADKLTLHPGKSLVINIGNDRSGSNRVAAMDTAPELFNTPINVGTALPEECANARTAIGKFLWRSLSWRTKWQLFLRRYYSK